MRISVDVAGAKPVAQLFKRVSSKLRDRRFAPLTGQLGELFAEAYRENIRTDGARLEGVTWPELKPATQRIRKSLGYGARGPRLMRRGDFVLSIEVLESHGRDAVVGSREGQASLLHEAFPYLIASSADLEEMESQVRQHFFGGGR